MKYILLALILLRSFVAISKDERAGYFKLECSGVKFTHIDTITGKRVVDNTIRKNVTIYLEQQDTAKVIIQDGNTIMRYTATRIRSAPEETIGYLYNIDSSFRLEMLVFLDSHNRTVLYGRKGKLNFEYIVTRTDLNYKGTQ